MSIFKQFLKKGRWVFLFCGSSLLIASGCDEEEPGLRLTANERVVVDTIYKERVQLIRPEIDSICDSNYDAWLARAVDSIIQIRKEEEARLRARVKIPK